MLYPAWESLNPIIRKYSWDQSFLFKIDGEPVNLTGFDLSLEILEEYDSTSVVTTLSVDSGNIVLGSFGEIDITMTPTQTEAINAGTYNYVASLTYPDMVITYPILIGKVNVVTWDKVGS
jgi:hypothetical protein